MVSRLPLHPGVRPPQSHDTPGGPGHVAVHSQRGSSQTAGQEPTDVHPADHQADPHRSTGVWGHPAASPCCTTALRLHQRQRGQGWVYVHKFIYNTVTRVSWEVHGINEARQDFICDAHIFIILYIPISLFLDNCHVWGLECSDSGF